MDKRSAPDRAALVRLGRVAGIHGLNGALKLRLDNPASSTLGHLRQVFLEHRGTQRAYCLVQAARVSRRHLKLVLEGVADLAQAQALRGAVLYVEQAAMAPPAPGEFYYFQVLGCEVRLGDGRRLGSIKEAFCAGASDVWVVREGDKEFLIPVIAEVVCSMDFEARVVTIEPLPGLLD